MKKILSLLFAFIGWFAIIAQYFLMIENRETSIAETTINFFSFFTILTNIIVAIYFTWLYFNKNKSSLINKPGTLTAITVYITVVGFIYQVTLRHLWQPHGLQLIVDELLHTIIPILVIIFWYLYETTMPVKYIQILKWAIYPLLYLFYILIRGGLTGLYPYPFIDVTNLGITKALINAGFLLLLFIVISCLFIFVGKVFIKR